MAGSFNKVILLGNLTRDVELKSTQSGQSVANIGLAVNRRWRTPDGEQREETTFIDCEAWGKTAEMIAQYFSKGRPVLLEGRLRLDTWQDKDSGQNRSKLKVLVENFSFVDSKPGAGGGGGGGDSHGGSSRPARPSRPQTQSEPGISEDDIPF